MANLRNQSILIIGCGTWGSSSALELTRRGYSNVTVLDSHAFPSVIAAGNDINKIVDQGSSGHGDDLDLVDEEVRSAAIQAWLNDPVFKDFYHPTGYVIAASKPENVQMLYSTERPTPEKGFVQLRDAEGFRDTMPAGVLTGSFPGWHGWYKLSGVGWCHARKAITAAGKEAMRLGARLICGSPEGAVTRLLLDREGKVVGARTADGNDHFADTTILCNGANAPQLLDMKGQLRPTAWTLAHIKMTPDEANLYHNLPVLFNVERGFFMEPDEDSLELKICDEHPGYCNWVKQTETGIKISLPFERHAIPKDSEEGIREFLRETMPHLADRPFSFARICWCADTPDRAFLISVHPEHSNLILAVGGSGHGFMQIPVIGKYIADCLEGRLDPRMAKVWRWRPETAVNRDWKDTQGRLGGSNSIRDFKDIDEDDWTSAGSPASPS